MGKPQTVSSDLDDAGIECRGDSGLRLAAGGRLDQSHRRIGERRNHTRNLERVSVEAKQALANEPLQICGNLQLSARLQTAALPLKSASELERKEWIPAGCFPDTQERGPRKDPAGAGSQHLAQGADAEGAERDCQ